MDVFDNALAVLLAHPGIWFCLACWARASGISQPRDQRELRAWAHSFPTTADPGHPEVDAAMCECPDHTGARLWTLCVRRAL